jgi:outer membrane immunogenic protein
MSKEGFMGTKFWYGIGVLASIAAATGAASAADLAVKAPPRVPVAPVYLSDWAGFYIGINGGYGWGETKFDVFTLNDAKPKGGLFGGHAGYNWQYGSVVAGLEADFDGADLKATDAGGFQHKTNELASTRARLGYTVFPGLLAYGTAGAGWGHTEITGAGLTFGAVNQFGWVAGAGLEYKLVEHVLLRAEYLHYDFAKTGPALVGDSVAETVNVVRGGLSYKF